MDIEGTIVVDSAEEFNGTSDTDSAIGSATPSDSPSLISGITNYRYEFGRRYHAYSEGHYYAPNDEQQNEQLDIFHHIYTLALDGKLFLAPVRNPKRVLDLGTGTGIWVMDVAEVFPKAKIVGNDLSPIQPTWVPANVEFEVDDFTKQWTYASNSISFIHARALFGSVENWPVLFREIYNALEPGGWVESVESSIYLESDDNTIPINAITTQWSRLLDAASKKTGKPFSVCDKLKGWLEEVGFVNVKQHVFKLPVGSWPKDPKYKQIGQFNLLNVLEGADGWTYSLFHKVLNWQPRRIAGFMDEVKKELKDQKRHAWFKLYVVYGQKPLPQQPRDSSPSQESVAVTLP